MERKFILPYLVTLLLAALSAVALPVKDNTPVSERTSPFDSDLPRLVIYFQTTHDKAGNPISMLPLITEKNIALTHLIVCSFHIDLGSVIHLNDYPPTDPRFYTLWNETMVLKAAGVTVMGMVGGEAPGSFSAATLDASDEETFEHYYGQLHDVIAYYGLQGMDLDVEQAMSQFGITRLVRRLAHDFGPDFVITLAPVASALRDPADNLSGFDYPTLEATAGSLISFYNAQFYNGWGDMDTPAGFEAIVASGWQPERVVVGQTTTPSNGYGSVPFDVLNDTMQALRSEYGEIGGIMGWEYFNSQPGGTAEPWAWAQEMTRILRPTAAVNLVITKETARTLESAWESSTIRDATGTGASSARPAVDYWAMVNA